MIFYIVRPLTGFALPTAHRSRNAASKHWLLRPMRHSDTIMRALCKFRYHSCVKNVYYKKTFYAFWGCCTIHKTDTAQQLFDCGLYSHWLKFSPRRLLRGVWTKICGAGVNYYGFIKLLSICIFLPDGYWHGLFHYDTIQMQKRHIMKNQ